MKTKGIIAIFVIISIVLTPVLVFIIGGFHFSNTYLFGRDIDVNRANEIGCGSWKYKSGYIADIKVDFIELNNSTNIIKNDTLYIGSRPVAVAVRLVHRCFSDYELTLRSLDGRKIEYRIAN
jgi:hypothetical protein